MASEREILPALREYDAALASAAVPLVVGRRLRWSTSPQGVQARKGRPSRWRITWLSMGLAVVTVAGLAVLAFALRRAPPAALSACTPMLAKGLTKIAPGCNVNLPSMRIDATAAVELEETAEGVRFSAGDARFSVEHVPSGVAPVRVLLRGGYVEIVGTQFEIHQEEYGGSIVVLEGRVRFVPSVGAASLLGPGERLTWGTVDEPKAPSSDRSMAAVSSNLPSERLATGGIATVPDAGGGVAAAAADGSSAVGLVEPEIAEPSFSQITRRYRTLKREGRYTEAELLRQELEPVSFELGLALERERAAKETICRHWRDHLRQFPAGIYNGTIRERLEYLGCDAGEHFP
ncbi:MAG TPA: hypothetical protein VJT73_19040 [Polyangiaceae bacterium]|nr:hypothetical protein [Polyangiaceae bacterium]